MRKKASFTVTDLDHFKRNLLHWAEGFDEAVWLEGNGHRDPFGAFDALLAVEGFTSLVTDFQDAFADLEKYQKKTRDWIFGYLSYDLKNDIEELSSRNFDGLLFPDLYFFQPMKIIRITGEIVDFLYLNHVAGDMEKDFDEIAKRKPRMENSPQNESQLGESSQNETQGESPQGESPQGESPQGESPQGESPQGESPQGESPQGESPQIKNIQALKDIRIKLRIFKDEYFTRIRELQQHIHRGDVYEANFCQEFYAEDAQIDAIQTFERLNAISKAPFSVFLKLRDKFLLSASPERYLRKKGNQLVSQPIKGTARRSLDPNADSDLKNALKRDAKERAENIMIVDLVRNDLSKSAIKGSVRVEALCEVYSFEQVHQMISTITAEVPHDRNPLEIIKETFPMGSMTGAPKISALKIIEDLEAFKRGLYSGAVGYFTPEGDFDFNVVIRSILYNATKKYLSYAVGSAITAKSIPEREYEECLLKAKAMREVLER
ncbi:MAG TPA: anthranilate synthase component I family protein [Pricia sp.]|nr:anthranilate synthase component I family protein [Pricia sp.]